jgi:serine/tyrosine/threonine adenylyltransferase
MHALGIPTTRALAVVATGENVYRELVLPGAVLTRVAASHLRVGSFQYFAARGEREALARIVDYAIARHDPTLAGTPDRVFAFLEAVARRQATLVAQWLNVGFIHGVMNTDNMTISGETIDYGPCAFLEAYDPQTVFSSIDTGGRYAFGNQPSIARWNLARLAEALLPLAVPDPDDEAEVRTAVARASAVIDAFPAWHAAALLAGQRAKLGVAAAPADDAADGLLAAGFLALLQAQRVDFTQAWRALADAAEGRDAALRDLFFDRAAVDAWLEGWRARTMQDARGAAERAAAMRAASPRIIPRNHHVEAALDAASDDGDLVPFERLLAALRRPFDDDPALAPFAGPAPAEVTAGYRTFCGT